MRGLSDRAAVFRYVAFCHFTGRLFVVLDARSADMELGAVGFAWVDWAEHIEARAIEGLPQFNWTKPLPDGAGDSVFVSDIMGDREACKGLWGLALRKWPDLVQRKLFTYRKERLVRMDLRALHRFLLRQETRRRDAGAPSGLQEV